jgi:hypothetical protein
VTLSPISYKLWSLRSTNEAAKTRGSRRNSHELRASLHIHDAFLISNKSENLSIRCLPSAVRRAISIISSRLFISQRNTPRSFAVRDRLLQF